MFPIAQITTAVWGQALLFIAELDPTFVPGMQTLEPLQGLGYCPFLTHLHATVYL